MRLFALSCLAFGVFVGGCARVATSSTLANDGSFDRKVVYTINPSQMGDDKAVDPKTLFRVPRSGDGVTVASKTDEKGVQTVTVSRKVMAGAPALQDIALLDDKKEAMATSTVLVRKLDDGRLEYLETLHWEGPAPESVKSQSEELRAVVKKALPEKYQKTELIDRATHKALVSAVHVILGPSEPAFADILINPDGATMRVTRLLFEAYADSLHDVFPDMEQDERRSIAKTIVTAFGMQQMGMDSSKVSDGPPQKASNNDMTPMYFEVLSSGKVVETNGLTDPLTGKVYWSLFASAIQVEDVTLRLVVQP